MKKSEFIDSKLSKITGLRKQTLNDACFEMFNNTTLEQRERIDKIQLLLDISGKNFDVGLFKIVNL